MWKQMTDVKSWLLYRNTWNHLTVGKKQFKLKNVINKIYLQIKYFICIEDLALNSLRWLICKKKKKLTKPNHKYLIYMYEKDLAFK